MPQRHSTRRDECRQIARCEIHPLRERSPLLAPCVDDSVRIMILCQKIIEQMSFARLAIGQDAQTGKLAIPLKTFASHDQRAQDRFTDARNFR